MTKRSTRRGKRSRMLRELRSADDRFGPDQSETVHAWPDGWTIRRLSSHSDIQREGALMHNCLADHPGADYGPDAPLGWWITGVACSLGDGEIATHSLRDEHNYPHVTFIYLRSAHGLIEA